MYILFLFLNLLINWLLKYFKYYFFKRNCLKLNIYSIIFYIMLLVYIIIFNDGWFIDYI